MNTINNNYPVANQNINRVPQIRPRVFNLDNLNNFGRNNIRLYQNNNNYINQNINNTINIKNISIFNSSSLSKDYFVFSLDELKNFYCNNQKNENNPQFSIFYDANRQTLYGQETLSNNQFKLSGKQEFNIKDFEIYNVEIGKL